MNRGMLAFALLGWTLFLSLALFVSVSHTAHAGQRDSGGIATATCPADIAPPVVGNGIVDVDDLLVVINAWGSCNAADNDGDGFSENAGDCNDSNPNIYPGATEVCNAIDDDCDTVIDDGVPLESPEPSSVCAGALTLVSTQDDGNWKSYSLYKVVPAGDVDWFRVVAQEASSGGCFPGSEEDFKFTVQLIVPPSATSSFTVEVRLDSCTGPLQSAIVLPGASGDAVHFVDGECGTDDNYTFYIRVSQVNPSATTCAPYTLQYKYEEL